METVPDELTIAEARANLSEVLNAVRLQDRTVRLLRRAAPQAGIVPIDILDLIEAAGGLNAARAALRKTQESDDD